MSNTVTNIIKPNNNTVPTIDIISLTFIGISLRVIPSNAHTTKCHPSNPGKGNKLTIAKFKEIYPQTYK